LLALNWAKAVGERCSVTLGLHNRQIVIPEAHSHYLDLESVDKLVRSIEETSPQVVIHTAGLTSVDRCESEPELAQHLNVTLTANIAKACAITGVGLVHISTDHLFSGQESMLDENQPIKPINVYGQTKADAEHQVLEANTKSLVIRTNFYGWGTSYRRSFSDIVLDELRSGHRLTLFNEVFFTPILAETLALAVHDLIDRNHSGIFNVVGDERISKNDFRLNLVKEFGIEFAGIRAGFFSDQPTFVHRPRDMSLSNQKVCNLLGRRLGGIKEHLARLHQQEIDGLAHKMKAL